MKVVLKWFLSILVGFAVAAIAAKCIAPVPPDPNDPVENRAAMGADAMFRAMVGMSDLIVERRFKGLMTDQEGRAALRRYAVRLAGRIDLDKVPPADAWKAADIFRTANDWKRAKTALAIAIANAQRTRDEDRRVNDSLRFAQALANLNDVPGAIKAARSTFNTSDENAAPILPATLMEIVPSAAGKGYDMELAALLEDAIGHHRRTIVDPKSKSGKEFLTARWTHIAHAYKRAIELYEAAGRQDLARRAALRAEQVLLSHRRV